jgi:hypothetical protein
MFLFIIIFFILSYTNKIVNSNELYEKYISIWLSSAAYCNKQNYKRMILNGPAKGFVVESILYEETTDMQGFIGRLNSTIYVVFRGTSSVLNWIDDFQIRKIKYETYPKECIDCYVHRGFYRIVQLLKNETIKTIKHSSRLHLITLTSHFSKSAK